RGAAGRAASARSVAASAEDPEAAAADSVAASAASAAEAAAAVAQKGGGRMAIMTISRRTVLALVVLVGGAIPLSGCSYNTFVTQEEAIKAQWAQVENQLQRRNDLIPNLVETVKGYAQHEQGVFKDIADARSRLLAAKSPEETIEAANQQTG